MRAAVAVGHKPKGAAEFATEALVVGRTGLITWASTKDTRKCAICGEQCVVVGCQWVHAYNDFRYLCFHDARPFMQLRSLAIAREEAAVEVARLEWEGKYVERIDAYHAHGKIRDQFNVLLVEVERGTKNAPASDQETDANLLGTEPRAGGVNPNIARTA